MGGAEPGTVPQFLENGKGKVTVRHHSPGTLYLHEKREEVVVFKGAHRLPGENHNL